MSSHFLQIYCRRCSTIYIFNIYKPWSQWYYKTWILYHDSSVMMTGKIGCIDLNVWYTWCTTWITFSWKITISMYPKRISTSVWIVWRLMLLTLLLGFASSLNLAHGLIVERYERDIARYLHRKHVNLWIKCTWKIRIHPNVCDMSFHYP